MQCKSTLGILKYLAFNFKHFWGRQKISKLLFGYSRLQYSRLQRIKRKNEVRISTPIQKRVYCFFCAIFMVYTKHIPLIFVLCAKELT